MRKLFGWALNLNTHQKELAKHLVISIVVIVSCSALPTPIWFLVAVPFLVMIIRNIRLVSVLLISLAFLFVRITSLCIVVLSCEALPSIYKSPSNLAGFFPPFSCLVFPDIGDLEANVALRRSLVTKPRNQFVTHGFSFGQRGLNSSVDFSKIDPFSGKPYLSTPDSLSYSVGPDLSDQMALVIYDPTNGTFSSGDIIRNKSPR